ncbi:MAG: DUF5680 domain-containing protein [Nanoarchaeota archaeon]|jgi:hypothetical protein|nr:DUF5680 domain-containing protein [Nanoarchaeota archaeon]
MDKESFLKFLAKAHKNTYAAPKEIKLKYKCETPILPNHKDYEFTDGDFRYHDSYAGNSWAPGREVVFFRNKAVWCMSYQGQTNEDLSEDFIDRTFEFLKKALMNFNESMPFRGPKEFSDGDFRYTFELEGTYKYFKGQERILYKNKSVFFQDVMGSLIK